MYNIAVNKRSATMTRNVTKKTSGHSHHLGANVYILSSTRQVIDNTGFSICAMGEIQMYQIFNQ
jgi:hypothetical protein